MNAITVTNLSKAYKQYPTRWSRLKEWLDWCKKPRHELLWVLQDINFTVACGQALGIIGINGAGKSTLLKMITGTTRPTTGRVEINGRVAALLELGMGFHPEFTGRQNAYMAGQLLGYGVEEITELMPDIEAFAEIGDYIDQPVRVYSSGMQMRLAFSVATARRPDVLIVDEALSVGDDYFQHKSFDRIRKFRKQGTTLLIVSHDKQAIQSICDRAILLSAGHLVMEGEPEAVMDYYNAMLSDHENMEVKQERQDSGKVMTVSGTGAVKLLQASLYDECARQIETLDVGQRVCLEILAECKLDVPSLVVGYMIKDRLGQSVFGTNTFHHEQVLTKLEQGSRVNVSFCFEANLGPGIYSIAIAFHADDTHVSGNYEWRDRALFFEVINVGQPDFVGVAWIPPQVCVKYE